MENKSTNVETGDTAQTDANTMLAEVREQIISYIENDAEIAIPIERFFNEDGSHITKKEYGKVLLEILCEELREHFR